MNPNQNQCMECGAPVMGRADKKFCDDSCRNSYNNRQNRNRNMVLRKVNRKLAQNRRILMEFSQHLEFIDRSALEARGFDFDYVTAVRQIAKDEMWYFCYDFAFSFLESGEIKILSPEKTTGLE